MTSMATGERRRCDDVWLERLECGRQRLSDILTEFSAEIDHHH